MALKSSISNIQVYCPLSKIYKDDRTKIDNFIKSSADDEARKLFEKEFDDMGDLNVWINNWVEKTAQDNSSLLEGEVGNEIRTAVAAAEAADAAARRIA